MTETNNQDQAIDKDFLYGKFEAGEERKRQRQDERTQIGLQLARKSLDLADDPEDNMEIQANQTTNNNNSGMGMKEIALIGLMMAGTGLGGAGVMSLLNADKNQPTPIVQPAEEDKPPVANPDNDTLFDLEFADPKPKE